MQAQLQQQITVNQTYEEKKQWVSVKQVYELYMPHSCYLSHITKI